MSSVREFTSSLLQQMAESSYSYLVSKLRNTKGIVPTGIAFDFPWLLDSEIKLAWGRIGQHFAENFVYEKFWDEENKTLYAVVAFSYNCEGPPGSVHGGALATMLDECFGWTVTRLLGLGSVTLNLNVNYKHLTPLGKTVLIEIRVQKIEGKKIFLEGKIVSPSNNENGDMSIVHAEATAIFYKRNTSLNYEAMWKLFGPKSQMSKTELLQWIQKRKEGIQKLKAQEEPQNSKQESVPIAKF